MTPVEQAIEDFLRSLNEKQLAEELARQTVIEQEAMRKRVLINHLLSIRVAIRSSPSGPVYVGPMP